MERRHFLMGVGGAASHAVFAQTTEKEITTGMIGVGNRGSYVMKGVMAQPNVKVTAVCDIKPDRLDAAATASQAKTFTDYRKLLDQKDIDAVVIATPPYLHVEMAIAAIKAGKHVYCEKPVGITPESVKELVKAAKNAKTVFQAGQQMRSGKQLSQAVERIRRGDIGDVLMVKAQRNSAADLPHDGPSGDWYFDVKKSGGYLIEMSVHNLDACNWAIGARPERAAGFGGAQLYKNDPPGRTIMDGYVLTYDYPNGVKLSYSQLLFHPRGLPNGNQYIYVYGSKGAVELLDASTFYPLEPKAKPEPFVPKQEEDRHAHVAAFYECIRTGKKPVADITIGATAALTAILGHEAMTRGKVATWKELGVDL
jgi:predicted dehydrogenase